MARASSLETRIVKTGALQFGEFTAHNGEQGNLKVGLDNLLNDPEHYDLRAEVEDELVTKLEPFKPEIVIPMPEGANVFGVRVARKLGARAILLEWRDKEQGLLAYLNQHERQVVCLTDGTIVFIDDVLRTGSTFEQATNSLGLSPKKKVAGVVWDRRRKSGIRVPALGYPAVSVVQKHYPLKVKRFTA